MRAPQQIVDALSGKTGLVIVTAVTSASISAIVTYVIASKRIEAKYALMIDAELDATRKFYAMVHEKPSLDALVQEIEDEVKNWATEDGVAPIVEAYKSGPPSPRDGKVQYNKVDPQPEPAPEEEEVFNVFEAGKTATDTLPQEMVDARTLDPYIITQDEFTDGQDSQDTLTYYADDGVLADTQDMPVDNLLRMVGPDALQSFGLGSGDPRIVYVRNEKISADFEIVLHDGNYGEIVHGITPEEPTPKRRHDWDE